MDLFDTSNCFVSEFAVIPDDNIQLRERLGLCRRIYKVKAPSRSYVGGKEDIASQHLAEALQYRLKLNQF